MTESEFAVLFSRYPHRLPPGVYMDCRSTSTRDLAALRGRGLLGEEWAITPAGCAAVEVRLFVTLEAVEKERDSLRADLALATQASKRVARAARAMIAARWAYECDTNVDTAETLAQTEVHLEALLPPENEP